MQLNLEQEEYRRGGALGLNTKREETRRDETRQNKTSSRAHQQKKQEKLKLDARLKLLQLFTLRSVRLFSFLQSCAHSLARFPIQTQTITEKTSTEHFALAT